ncbi:SRPBCC domain-containing protein [Mesorhizobium ciceri]|uniref:Activator of Hsp90 ATPase 1 family protein n=1 Tax=Mesorhizobium ciceri biovar biserrulae (strain HAMBI 2942 / LMG 23838 / WSM1271) TaxID=765698 RepID=E8TF87_MESCW|nr:SRPBCC domain-containing protein [Mesorhizobium ciceri]ADV13427.1 Activator of Hsp90 ATPase 1 family protein [Mesorhizobium ciceri biovar biserrulae WSM1271]
MTTKLDIAPTNDRELVLARIIDAPRENVYRCWTDPKLITRWFSPKPWTTPRAEMDVRAGGSSLVVMASPDGNEFPNPGVFLEVVAGRKIVLTARVRHWSVADREQHEKMGFHEGWGQCADQLEELAKTL